MIIRDTKIVLVLAAGLLVLSIPLAAHAAGDSAFNIGLGDSLYTAAAKVLGAGLETVRDLLVSGMTTLGGWLTWAIGLQPGGGGAVIYASWSILRNLCNLAFIVVIILTAFGTIFNTFQLGFLAPYNIYNKKLIGSFMLAALTMNFSLAIGQTIVGLGNKISNVMVTLVDPKHDLGGQIAKELEAAYLVGTKEKPLSSVGIQTATISGQQTDQSSTVLTTDQKKYRNDVWEYIFLTQYLGCVNANGVTTDNTACYKTARNVTGFPVPFPDVATPDQSRWSAVSGPPPEVTKQGGILGIGAVSSLANPHSVAARALTPGVSDVLPQIASTLYSIFLLMALLISFLAVVIFMLIRIPFLWIILVLSPLAWVSLVFPNTSGWKDWWKQFMAWNIFSPAYLFVIYIGMYLLSQQGPLLNQLRSNGSAIDQQIGALLFYVMTAFIFVGGAAMVVKFSFAGGTTAGEAFGKISGALGITGEYGAIGGAARLIGGTAGAAYRYSGAEANVQALGQRAAQIRGDIGASLRGRAPALFGSKEEALAAAQQRFGVRGGTEQFDKLAARRVKEERERVEQPLKEKLQAMQKELALARTPEERKRLQDQVKNLEEQNTQQLKSLLRSGNRDAALAAGEILLEKGKLTPEEIEAARRRYAALSPVALSAFNDRAATQLIKDAKSREYKDAAEMESYMATLEPKKAKEFLDAAETGKNKIMAYDAAVRRKLIIGADGKPVSTLDQVLIDKAETLNEKDLLDVDRLYADKGGPPAALNDIYASRLGSVRGSAKMLRDAQGSQQRERIMSRIQDIGTREQRRKQEREGEAYNKQFESSVNKAQEQAEKESTRKKGK